MDNKGWQKKRGLASKIKRNKTDLRKHLQAQKEQVAAIDFLICQFEILFDKRVIAPRYPDFSSLSVTRERFLDNITCLPKEIPSHGNISHLEFFPWDFDKAFCDLITPIEKDCARLLDILPFLHLHLEGLKDTTGGNHNSFWIAVLKPFDTADALLAHLKIKIEAMTSELTVRLKAEVERLPPNLSQEEVEAIINYINDVTFNQSLFLTRCIMVLEDAETILTGRFSLTLKHLPPSMANLIRLEGVDEMIQTLRQKPVVVEAAEVLAAVVAPVEVVPAEVPLDLPIEDKEDEEEGKVAKSASIPPPAPFPKTPLDDGGGAIPLERDFLQLKKTRLILARLEEVGFKFLKNNGHSIYEREEVIVEEDGSERTHRRAYLYP